MESIYSSMRFSNEQGNLLKSMQLTFDMASKQNKILWEQSYADRWFTTNLPQYGLSCEGIIGKYNLRFLASIIGEDSTTPLRPTDGFDTWRGEIPRIGHRFLTTAKTLRKLSEIYENSRLKESQKFQELKKTMLGDFEAAYLGTKDVVDHMILRALSNAGVADFSSSINPDGITYRLDYNMPKENQKTVAKEWTNENISTVDCFKELDNLRYEFAARGITFGETLMSPEVKHYIKRSSLLRAAIHGSTKSQATVTDGQFDAYWAENGLPPITLITKKNAIQKDGKRLVVNPWNTSTIVLKPAGIIGALQPAFEDNEILPEEKVEYVDAGNGLRIAKWRVGESSAQIAGEYTQGSWRVVPIIHSIDAIVNLKVKNSND